MPCNIAAQDVVQESKKRKERARTLEVLMRAEGVEESSVSPRLASAQPEGSSAIADYCKKAPASPFSFPLDRIYRIYQVQVLRGIGGDLYF